MAHHEYQIDNEPNFKLENFKNTQNGHFYISDIKACHSSIK